MHGRITARRLAQLLLGAALAAAVLLATVACGGGGDGGGGGGTSEGLATTAPEIVLPTGGATTLVLGEELTRLLADNLISVLPFAPASAAGEGIAFPIAGGSLDVAGLTGGIHHEGGLVLVAGDAEVALTALVLDGTARRVTAIAGGGVVPLLDLDVSDVRRSGDAGGVEFAGLRARLTEEGAIALNGTLGVDAFRPGLDVGRLTIRAVT